MQTGGSNMTDQAPQSEQQTEQTKTKVNVRYDKTDTVYASQFVINASPEELIVNFSPGYITDPRTNEQLLPIQTRIALTPTGAARLVQTLSAALRNLQAARPAASEKAEQTITEEASQRLI
jgi:hypothetical protein